MKKLTQTRIIIFMLVIMLPSTLFAQIVNIPDVNFKSNLIANLNINTNADSEIQVSEAALYTGPLDISNLSIGNITGIEAFTSINYLNCNSNLFDTLDVSANVALDTLICYDIQLEYLNTSGATGLLYLDCSLNQFDDLDLSANTSLVKLNCGYNVLQTITLPSSASLTWINLNLTFISSLDVSSYTNLTHLDIGGFNLLTSLDVSANTTLTYLNCSNGQLTSLNVNNTNNTNFTYFNASSNPFLTCIQVDDSVYSSTNWTYIDGTAHFGNLCPICSDVLGHVSYTGGDVGNGYAVIYNHNPFYATFDTLQIQPLDFSGNYHFTNVSAGNYLVKIYPDTLSYPDITSTYYNDQWLWDSATVINHSCLSDDIIDVVMIELNLGGGFGLFHGQIIEGYGFGRSPGDPIPNIDVRLGITGSPILTSSTTTDSNGNFTFENLSFGTYTVYVDIPGIQRDSCYTITIDGMNNQFLCLNYIVDSVSIYYIDPCGSVAIENSIKNQVSWNVYPNPSSGNITIKYTIDEVSTIKLDIYDMLGSIVTPSLLNKVQESGDYQFNLRTQDYKLKPGIYFISLSIDNKTTKKRIILTE